MAKTQKRRGAGSTKENIPGANKVDSKAPSRKHIANLPHNRPNSRPDPVPAPESVVLSMPDMPPVTPWADRTEPLHVALGCDPHATEILKVTQRPPVVVEDNRHHRQLPALPPPTEKQLGIMEGMFASGATERAVRKRLGWSRRYVRDMMRQHPILHETMALAMNDDADTVINAIRQAALTKSGKLRKGGLAAATRYLALRHHLGVHQTNNNFNQQNNFNMPGDGTPGGVLKVKVRVDQTEAELEAELHAQQTHLQEHSQYVKNFKTRDPAMIDVTPNDEES